MTELLFDEHQSLPRFNIAEFSQGSFLPWQLNAKQKRELVGMTILEAIIKILSYYPNVNMVRGSNYGLPFGESGEVGEYSIGNIRSATDFARKSYRQANKYPTLYVLSLPSLINHVYAQELRTLPQIRLI